MRFWASTVAVRTKVGEAGGIGPTEPVPRRAGRGGERRISRGDAEKSDRRASSVLALIQRLYRVEKRIKAVWKTSGGVSRQSRVTRPDVFGSLDVYGTTHGTDLFSALCSLIMARCL